MRKTTDQWPTSLRAAALLLLAVLLACGRESGGVENLGIFAPSRTSSVLGQDGCTPIPVGNRVLWSFGDTILGSWKAPVSVSATFDEQADMKGMLSNSMAVTALPDDTTIATLDFRFVSRQRVPVPVIEHRYGEDPSRIRLWALDGIAVGQRVYLYYLAIAIRPQHIDPSTLPFVLNGTGIAIWDMPAGWREEDPVRFERGPLVFTQGEPAFGDAVIRQGDYCYLIGHGPAGVGKSAAFIARVAPAAIRQRRAYEFLDAQGGWTSDVTRAVPLFGDVMGEPSLSYNEHLRRFVVIYCSLDGAIAMTGETRLADMVQARPKIIYTPPPLPLKNGKKQHYYSGKEIWHTPTATYAIYIHPGIYQPMLLRIANEVIVPPTHPLQRILQLLP